MKCFKCGKEIKSSNKKEKQLIKAIDSNPTLYLIENAICKECKPNKKISLKIMILK